MPCSCKANINNGPLTQHALKKFIINNLHISSLLIRHSFLTGTFTTLVTATICSAWMEVAACLMLSLSISLQVWSNTSTNGNMRLKQPTIVWVSLSLFWKNISYSNDFINYKVNKCSIGSWKWNFPPFKEFVKDNPTNQLTRRTDLRLIGKFHFQLQSKENKYRI